MLSACGRHAVRLLRRHWTTCLLGLCVCYIYLTLQEEEPHALEDKNPGNALRVADGRNSTGSDTGVQCRFPELEDMPEQFLKYFRQDVKFGCLPTPNWVDVYQGKIKVTPATRARYGDDLRCLVIPILRKDEYRAKYDITSQFVLDENGTGRALTDFMKVQCSSNGDKYDNLHLTVVPKAELSLPAPYPEGSLGVDVLIFGFDSVSRVNWKRNLPLSHRYFVEKMGGVVMEGYNIVGDGTPQALIPILMGRSELELPEVRRGYPEAVPMDNLTWIWKDFRRAGYVTQWGEDSPKFGTFQYRMLGFKEPPVDHYMRPFQMVVEEERGQHPPLCLGHKTQFQYMIDYVSDLFEAYPARPKMSFMFHSYYTHGSINNLTIAEKELFMFLKHIHTNKLFSNTVLILMSDHGQRTIPELRMLLQGKYEERLPYFGISLPEKVRNQYPELVKNLQHNKHRLTTPFDFHETLRDFLEFDIKAILGKQRPSRGLSLLREIPRGRSCQQAQIPPHWCTCLRWRTIGTDSDNARAAAWALINRINELTRDYRHLCQELNLEKILKVEVSSPEPKLVQFVKNIDADGRIGYFDEAVDLSSENSFQVTVLSTPNQGLYEATIRLREKSSYEVDTSQISRLNRYEQQPQCIQEAHPHLRPYCYCRNQPTR